MADPQLAVQDLWPIEGGRTSAPCHQEKGPGGGTRAHGGSSPKESCGPFAGSDLAAGGRSSARVVPLAQRPRRLRPRAGSAMSSWTPSFWALPVSRWVAVPALMTFNMSDLRNSGLYL